MGIEDALGLELFCCLVYKKFTEYRETRFKSPTEKLTIRQYIVYQQPIHPPHLCTYQCKPHGGGEYGQGVGIWQILKFFDQIPRGGKRKVNQKCQKSPHPRGKNLNKQYYNTI